MAFLPYLNFGGTCREAFTRYQEIFGGELTLLSMADIPGDQEVPPEQADLVNHTTADAAEAERVFEELSEGGSVEMPIGPTFWSPAFGVCTDRFGTPWMVNAQDPNQQA